MEAQTEYKYYGRDDDELEMLIDGDNDLEITIREVEVETAYIYVSDEQMKEFRKGIKRVLKGKINEYAHTCNEDGDDRLIFQRSDFYKGHMNIFTEGANEVFIRLPFDVIKQFTKDLKALRKIMKEDAE